MQIKLEDIERCGHKDDWKYLVSVSNALDSMKYCRCLMDQIQEDIRNEFSEYESKVRKPTVDDFPLGFMAKVGKIRVNRQFIVNLNVINFFQYAANCLDYVAQIVNAFYAYNRLDERNVSFGRISKDPQKTIKSKVIADLLIGFRNEQLYDYIIDFNNLKKHNCDIGLTLSISNDADLKMSGNIEGFTKNITANETHTYSPVDGEERMTEAHLLIHTIATTVLDSIYNDFIRGA